MSAEAGGGGRLLDVCDDVRAPVAFSCRGASCGTCRVEVVAGADLLAPPARGELEVLALFIEGRGSAFAVPSNMGSAAFAVPSNMGRGSSFAVPFDSAPRSHRLACQAIVSPGPGLIQLRWVGRTT
jgi:hypothetical protein